MHAQLSPILAAAVIGLAASSTVFAILTLAFAREVFWRTCAKLRRPLGAFVVLGFAIVAMAAATQINLTTQVQGVLPTANGGTGQNSTATFPASGTLMTTTTNVTAAQLPNPSASTLGGVESLDCTGSGHIVKISTSGVPTCAADGGANLNQGAPSGTINGSNTTFTLSPTPAAAANVDCFENGLQQQQGAGNDYTISGATITYLTAPPTGAKLNCLWY